MGEDRWGLEISLEPSNANHTEMTALLNHFSSDFERRFVVSQGDEYLMPQVTVIGPFHE